MFNIGVVFCVVIVFNFCIISLARELVDLTQPNVIVEIAHRVAASKDMRPASLLLLELGSILTQGSFTTYYSLIYSPCDPIILAETKYTPYTGKPWRHQWRV